jgi:hypothetical protein
VLPVPVAHVIEPVTVAPTVVQEVVDVAAVPPEGMLKLPKLPTLSMYNPWLLSVNWSE